MGYMFSLSQDWEPRLVSIYLQSSTFHINPRPPPLGRRTLRISRRVLTVANLARLSQSRHSQQ